MTEQEKTTMEKVIASLRQEMEKWANGKQTGQLQLEINYSCGGLSKVYIIAKNCIK
jgi:hypothetical protein